MHFTLRVAPARLLRCAGAFVCICLITACENSPLKRQTALDIGTDTIQLSRDVDLHEIVIKSETGKDFEPARLSAKTGDVLRFKTADARTHVVSFIEASLPDAAKQLFASKNQLRSPPLVVSGVTWIVTLDTAPAGTYRFRCETHGYGGEVVIK